QVANLIKRVSGAALGQTPTIGHSTIGVVGIAQDFNAGLVELVRYAAVFIIIPRRHLVLPILEGKQITGGAVSETIRINAHADLVRPACGGIVGVSPDFAELIGIAGGARYVLSVVPCLDATVGVSARAQAPEIIIGIDHTDAIAVGRDQDSVRGVVNRGADLSASILDRCQTAQVVIKIGDRSRGVGHGNQL